MKYEITRTVSGNTRSIPSSAAEFADVHSAKQRILQVLSLEEKFNLVLENYWEFERELLDDTLTRMMFNVNSWSTVMSSLYAANRRLLNLLTSCRLYVDSLPHSLNELYGADSLAAESIDKKRRAEHSQRLGYRVAEALRNFVQHRDLPVYGFSNQRWKDSGSDPPVTRHTISPTIDVQRLADDKKFKASVLKELQALGPHIEIKPMTREYVDGLRSLHAHLRELLSEDLKSWSRRYEDIITRYKTTDDESLAGLGVIELSDDGEITAVVSVFPDLLDRLNLLVMRNETYAPYERQVITSEVRGQS